MKKSRTFRALSLLIVLQLLIGLVPLGTVSGMGSDSVENIIFIETENKLTEYECYTGDVFPQSILPESVRAVVSIDEVTSFVEASPAEGAVPDGYTPVDSASHPGLYRFSSGGAIAYRIYASVNEASSWYACNEDATVISGKIVNVPISWDLDDISTDAAGTFAFFASASGYAFDCTAPKLSLTVLHKSGDQIIADHSIEWIAGSSTTVIDGDLLSIAPDENTRDNSSVRLRVNFSFGGEENIAPGKINIKIPAHIFRDRNGEFTGFFNSPLPIAPNRGETTGFNYTVDEENNEIIISNWDTIAPSTVLTCQFAYYFTPYKILDGYINDSIQAKYSMELSDGTLVEQTSSFLEIKVESNVPKPTADLKVIKKYERWRDELWGTQPQDEGDWLYVVWQYTSNTPNTATQPYDIHFENEISLGGEIIGWYPSGDMSGAFTRGNKEAFENHIVYQIGENELKTGTQKFDHSVVIRYPRAAVENNNNEITSKYKTLVNGIDGKHSEAEASFTYKYPGNNVTYPGDLFEVNKMIKSGVILGEINLLETNNPATPQDWRLSVYNRGYGLTEGGTKNYTTYLEDTRPYVFVNNAYQQLNKDDYTLKSFSVNFFREYVCEIDEEYKQIELTDYNQYNDIVVFIKTIDDTDWVEYGTMSTSANNGKPVYSFKVKGAETAIQGTSWSLPDETYAVSFRHTGNRYKVEYSFYLKWTVNPTPNILSLIDGLDTRSITNIAHGLVKDSNGEIPQYVSVGKGYIPSSVDPNFKTKVRADYTAETGITRTICHFEYGQGIDRIRTESTINFNESDAVTDGVLGVESIRLTVKQYDSTKASNTNLTEQMLQDMKILNEHRDGTFYILLPVGTTVDLNSINAYDHRGANASRAVDYTVELVDNWRGSKQTMMIVNVAAKPGVKNIHVHNSTYYSGFQVAFNLKYTWEDMQDFGEQVKIDTAYYSHDGSLAEGLPDVAPSDFERADMFFDLDGDGNTDSSLKPTIYDSQIITFNPLIATELGFKKAVKSSEDTRFQLSTTAMASGTYTYQLRFGNGKENNAKNLIIYDVLESALPQTSTPNWKGSFLGVEIRRVAEKNLAPVIYYSTNPSIGNLTAYEDFRDLTDTEKWTTQVPADLKDVTAIAIDLSKRADGTDFVLAPEEVIQCFVTMRAPGGDVSCYLDNPDTPEDETIYAYNSAYMAVDTQPANGGLFTPAAPVETSRVMVALRSSEIELRKSSDPASGTASAPTQVDFGEVINYFITVRNNEVAETFHEIVVEDEIPKGLDFDIDDIMFYFGNDPSLKHPLSQTDRITVSAQGRRLSFTVDKLATKESVHFIIPTKTEWSILGGRKYINTARITSVNGEEFDLESETTYHKSILVPPDMGIILDSLPYILILSAVILGAVIIILQKLRSKKDE